MLLLTSLEYQVSIVVSIGRLYVICKFHKNLLIIAKVYNIFYIHDISEGIKISLNLISPHFFSSVLFEWVELVNVL